MDRGLLVNLDKSKMLVFNTMQARVVISEPEFFMGKKKMPHFPTHS